MSLDDPYRKTDAGRSEINARQLELTVRQRSLLILADGQRTANELLSMVRGCSTDDLEILVKLGLVSALTPISANSLTGELDRDDGDDGPSTVPSAWSTLDWPGPAEPQEFLRRQELHEVLTFVLETSLSPSAAKHFKIEVDSAASLDELRLVAMKMTSRIELERGRRASREAKRALGIRR